MVYKHDYNFWTEFNKFFDVQRTVPFPVYVRVSLGLIVDTGDWVSSQGLGLKQNFGWDWV